MLSATSIRTFAARADSEASCSGGQTNLEGEKKRMLKEALQYLVGLKPIERFSIDSREYASAQLHPVTAPLLEAIAISTLRGFLDLLKQKFEEFAENNALVHVADYQTVYLIARVSDLWARRTEYIKCKMTETRGFPFGQWLDHESFVIGLLSNFVESDELKNVVQLASNITNERVSTSEDDGISQTVGIRAGVHLKEKTEVKYRVKLAPFRTFREVQQPESEFVLRLSQNNPEAVPKLALFEADGGKWKLDAIDNVARFLASGTNIPVVS